MAVVSQVYPDYYLLPIPSIIILSSLCLAMKEWRVLIVTCSVILVLVISYNSVLHWFTGLPHPENKGAFGDQFGALSCLFSGLAFAGLIATLKQQHDEMQEMKKEAKISQFAEEVYRRIDFIKKLELSCCVDSEEPLHSNTAVKHTVTHKGFKAIDIIIKDIEKIKNWDDEKVEMFANENIFITGSIKAWVESSLQFCNLIHHEVKLEDDKKLYYMRFFLSSIPAAGSNLMYLWYDMLQIPDTKETIDYLMKHNLISPPEYYRNSEFRRRYKRCVEINNEWHPTS